MKCKHLRAVEFMMRETTAETVVETNGTGITTETTREVRVKYTRNWAAYNASQVNEKEHVGLLLRSLCEGIVQPTADLWPPRLPLADLAQSAAMKV